MNKVGAQEENLRLLQKALEPRLEFQAETRWVTEHPEELQETKRGVKRLEPLLRCKTERREPEQDD